MSEHKGQDNLARRDVASDPFARQWLDEIADRFEAGWREVRHGASPPRLEDFVAGPHDPRGEALLSELIGLDIDYRRLRGESPRPEDYLQRFPQFAEQIQKLIAASAAPIRPGEMVTFIDRPDSDTDSKGAASNRKSAALPSHIGRYRVEKVLGKGGFGIVYLAHDDRLQRLVAIKVPHARLISNPKDAEAYLAEARTVANLDHPHIVPVHDVGSTEHFPCFVVSKYIDGTDLAMRLKQSRLTLHDAVELVATVAEALHFAHKQGLVHRDIKPGNLLLDTSGKPFVADFGLALREQDVGKGPRYVGTPAYMSPEQARGEGHRVDGRSDIFSVGVVLYELLVGRRPFKADSRAELLEQITSFEPRPPRQYDDQIPKELDRICLKALSKRASERYSTAHDMAEDLRHFLAESPSVGKPTVMGQQRSETEATTPVPTPTTAPASDSQPIKIVPKGLRSFDAHDADFFLELLPGPRDRDGLPDSLRFWKTRIEETDADQTFSVGLIYGPSGCGKSSLVKAGLLPRLSQDVIAVYVEATAAETETRLLNGLRKRCPAVPDNLSLKETLAALRRGQDIPVGKKVLIVLDQFEQWLHAKKEDENTELVQALRQCEGSKVQCIVMVRDDFWLAVSRFLRELEIRLVEGQNSALTDLFDLDHARKVLAAFGRAFGKLPENSADKTSDQKQFLEQAVSGLAQEGKVISVRLALFAEMMKSKAWTPASLKAVGGTEGVGVTFLEETFSAATAPPEHRFHQKAARGVLKALLPASGTDIKGHMRSYAELLEASGYGNRPKDFDELIRILDGEIRLITPTDPEGQEESSTSSSKAGEKYYQLTHDYLVHSLRDWLTKKQKESWRGRAALRLEERAAQWHRQRASRHLPSLFEYTSIVCGVPNRQRNVEQRRMMRAATRHHGVRWVSLLLLLLATLFGIERHLAERQRIADDKTATTRINVLVANATADGVPFAIDALESLREIAIPKLQALLDDKSAKPVHRVHAAYALAKFADDNVVSVTPASGKRGPTLSDIITAILDYVPDADGAEAKNMVIALRLAKNSALSTQIAERIQAIDLSDEVTRSKRLSIKVRYAALAMYLGDPSLVAPMLQLGPDPTERTAFTLRLKDWPAELSAVREILQTTTDESLRSGVVAAIGHFPKTTIADFDSLSSVLQELFVTAPDSGSHSAIDWTLRQWSVELPDLKSERSKPLTPAATAPRRWYTNSAGMTFVEIPAGTYVIGDEPTPQEQTRQETFQPVSVKSQYEPHVVTLEATLKEKPDDLQATFDRGIAHFHLRHDEQAIADLSKIIEKEPTNVFAVQFRAIAHARQKHAKAAREDLKQFEELVTEETSTKAYVRVLVASLLGDGKAELAALDRQLTQHADESGWLYDGACVYAVLAAHTTDDGAALTYGQRALSLLQSAFAHGYSDLRHMASDPDLDSLHMRAEFRALLQPKPTKPPERPRVELTRPVYLSNRELTVAQFLAFVSDLETPANQKPQQWGPEWEQSGKGVSPENDCPMQTINWFDSALYCNWLSRKEGSTPCYTATGKKLKAKDYENRDVEVDEWLCDFTANGYRLPTEAEWEVSCRAGTTTTWNCGKSSLELGEFAVMASNSDGRPSGCGVKLPNGWGLFDMHGNVWEWSHDWYDQTVPTGRDPQGPFSGSNRVLRGCSWLNPAGVATSALRHDNTPVYRNIDFGVRLAQVPGARKGSVGASGAAAGP